MPGVLDYSRLWHIVSLSVLGIIRNVGHEKIAFRSHRDAPFDQRRSTSSPGHDQDRTLAKKLDDDPDYFRSNYTVTREELTAIGTGT